jgi:thiol:disulfide interchange protein DsbC
VAATLAGTFLLDSSAGANFTIRARSYPYPLNECRAMRHPLARFVVSSFAATFLAGIAWAQSAPAAKTDSRNGAQTAAQNKNDDPRAVIVKKFGDIKLEDVRMSAVSGVYEVTRGAQISYVTADGRYAFVGDMIDIEGDTNLSENRRRAIRARMIEAVPEAEMLVFSPKDPKYVVTVFTDIDCGYCRRLHSQIAEYNKLGIGVRYLFFPRSGPNTESWEKAEAVWCASNRNDALTRAKNGEDLKSAKCPTDIVKRDFELGMKLNVEGTPAIFLASGEVLPGYAPPNKLLRYLKSGNW